MEPRGEHFQFQRQGYFVIDLVDFTPVGRRCE